MALPVPPLSVDDREFYPRHEKDDVAEISFHERVVRYFPDAIAACAPEWFVTGNTGEEESTRLARFQNILRVSEHLYFDPDGGKLALRRLGPQGYEAVEPAEGGRLESEQLRLAFALDDEGFPWVYTPSGERLLTHEEEGSGGRKRKRD
jgi:hypothetical protein